MGSGDDSARPGQSAQFVTCFCNSCSGGIEFDRDCIDAQDPPRIPCPHCGTETVLYIPDTGHTASEISAKPSAPFPVRTSTRITMTKAHCQSPPGQELISLLCAIEPDGLITREGVQQLLDWLRTKSDTGIPAFDFLSVTSERILGFAEFMTRDAFEMQSAIERVLPKDLRAEFVAKRQHAWPHSPASQAQLDYIRGLGGNPPPGLTRSQASAMIDRLNPATEKQIAYILQLGGNPPPGLGKRAASELIERLLIESETAATAPTPRQMMVLRFWNKLDLMTSPRATIVEWLDSFYQQDPRRKLAWETFKMERGDDGSQQEPSSVPIGVGEIYLRNLPLSELTAPPSQPVYFKTTCPFCGIHIEHEAFNGFANCPNCRLPVNLSQVDA
jgi:hypothetical protein